MCQSWLVGRDRRCCFGSILPYLRSILRSSEKWRRSSHELLPDGRGQRAAGYTFHRRVVVVADPNPDYNVFAETDEPCVSIILARASFSGRAAVDERCAAPGTAVDHAPEQFGHLASIRERLFRWAAGCRKASDSGTFGPECSNAPGLELCPACANRRERRRQIEKSDFIGAQGHAGDGRELRGKTEFARRIDHFVETHIQAKTYRGGVN